MRPEDSIALLASIPLFRSVGAPALRELAGEVTWIEFSGGETLFRQGDAGDALYVLMRGRLRAFDDSQDGLALGEIGQGESVGEMALLSGAPRTATVKAIRDSLVVKLTKEVFDRLVMKYPQMMQQISLMVVDRLRVMIESTQVVDYAASAPVVTIAVVPVTADVPMAEFMPKFVKVFSGQSTVLHLTGATLDRVLGAGATQVSEDDPRNSDITAWLDDQEDKCGFVIYEAEPANSSWTSRCFRQADCILLVAAGGSDPGAASAQIDSLRSQLSRVTARKELVLVHQRRDVVPTGTMKWIKALAVDRHHQVHLGTPSDFASVYRFLTGKSVGLVLSGGGARALAHIGAIRALQEAGIPIDFIGGASLGAAVAAQFAMGWDLETVIRMAKKGLVDSGRMEDFVFPIVSLIASRRFMKVLIETFGDAQIEDLWTRFFCVTTNLTQAKLMVHQEGLLRRWLRAGASVPGIAPPECYEADLLVDGGVLNNIPVDVMKKLVRGPVIAVDVAAERDLTMRADHHTFVRDFNQHRVYLPRAARIILNRLNPFGKRIPMPFIHDILLQTAGLSSVVSEAAWKEHTELYIKPPVGQFKLLDFQAIDKLVEIGYETAVKEIPKWRGPRNL